jgi:serine/threonine-protein kinase
VALKFMRLGVLDDREALGRFMREARAAAALRSEHVARVMDVEVDLEGGAPYIVMEYLEGRDLGSMIESGAAPSPGDAVAYVLQACEGLAEAHAKGIVHRDLKPANLFLTRRPDGTPLVKVLDFGVSKLNEPVAQSGSFHLTGPSRALGSPLYMSPEQMVASPHVDPRADIWALGVILYELLSGKPPFDAPTLLELGLAIANQPHPPLHQRVPGLAPGLVAVVDRCLQKQPPARFNDLAGLAAALAPHAGPDARASAARIAATLGVTSPGPPPGPSPRERPYRRAVFVAAIGVGLAAGAALLFSHRTPARVPPAPVASPHPTAVPLSAPPAPEPPAPGRRGARAVARAPARPRAPAAEEDGAGSARRRRPGASAAREARRREGRHPHQARPRGHRSVSSAQLRHRRSRRSRRREAARLFALSAPRRGTG